MVFKLTSVFQAGRVTKCLVWNGFYINFSILRKAYDTVFGFD